MPGVVFVRVLTSLVDTDRLFYSGYMSLSSILLQMRTLSILARQMSLKRPVVAKSLLASGYKVVTIESTMNKGSLSKCWVSVIASTFSSISLISYSSLYFFPPYFHQLNIFTLFRRFKSPEISLLSMNLFVLFHHGL